MQKPKKILTGTLHDSFQDENGKEICYTECIVGFWVGQKFYCAALDPENKDISTMELSKNKFDNLVTNVSEIYPNNRIYHLQQPCPYGLVLQALRKDGEL